MSTALHRYDMEFLTAYNELWKWKNSIFMHSNS